MSQNIIERRQRIAIALRDCAFDHNAYLTELADKVARGEASENTLKTQKQQRNKETNYLRIIANLLEGVEEENTLGALEAMLNKKGGGAPVALAEGMKLVDLMIERPNLNMKKVNELMIKQGFKLEDGAFVKA